MAEALARRLNLPARSADTCFMTKSAEAAACRRIFDPDGFNNLPRAANCR
jgi:hypothetical protein